jgi:hypothetical protein
MSDCHRAGKLFGGCRFSPRYDEVSATDPIALVFATGSQAPVTQGRKTYLCDVCATCGKTLFRRKQSSQKP